MPKSELYFGFIALLAVLVGCGGPEQFGRVSGRVTLDGEPVQGASVQFIPQEGSAVIRPSFGLTDKDGYYVASTSNTQPGVAIGTCRVEISTDDIANWKGKEYVMKELFPPKYRSADHVVTIEKGANTIDFACQKGNFGGKSTAEQY